MLIRVMYADGRLGLIKPHQIDSMVDRKVVSGILRSNGWAIVGRDMIRRHRHTQGYDGVDRRACCMLNDHFGMGSPVKLLQEILFVTAMLAFIFILFTGLF